MVPYSWTSRNGALARYTVQDQFQWLSLVGRLRQTLANPPEILRSPIATLQQNDRVRTQRDLVIGGHRIASGSIGTVTGLHRRPLVEVVFADEPPVSLTIAGYDLKRAVGA